MISKGRPVSNLRPDHPTCETCRCLRVDSNAATQRAAGRLLDPVNCSDFKPCNRIRNQEPGTSGHFPP